eukprot:CAMPEP_0173384994 /NCGR_PEP_ID=MMETSP1356-20130122/7568_1 /TAXON_ID=77927 ORGANISM="Hemiselmis virescens, Strain PCC157" /NCGR_SAMPLE_ID=MMETSP1356 /ASSEMBLY_ACC=CAM_ASM_000847 /LENGTH=127 /DNA_ID=CAMNT_0014340601 /DNA_START=108 /DNA_END=491 /DNA_ORIENTATION=+
MSMNIGRRELAQGAAAAAVVAPLLRPDEASAALGRARGGPRKPLTAPVITILDHRGCSENSKHQEYKGQRSNDENDEMCIVVKQKVIAVSEADAAKKRQEYLSFNNLGMGVEAIYQLGPNYVDRGYF